MQGVVGEYSPINFFASIAAFEAHPAVEILLDLTSERDVPVLYERIRLELCSLLTKQKRKPFGEEHQETMRETDLGNGKYAEMKEPRRMSVKGDQKVEGDTNTWLEGGWKVPW